MTASTPVAPKPTGRDAPEYVNRRGVVSISHRTLHGMLDLPEGYRIVSLHTAHDPMCVQVVVESDALPDVPPDAYLPFLAGGWTTRGVLAEDGKLYQRFEWRPEVAQ